MVRLKQYWMDYMGGNVNGHESSINMLIFTTVIYGKLISPGAQGEGVGAT